MNWWTTASNMYKIGYLCWQRVKYHNKREILSEYGKQINKASPLERLECKNASLSRSQGKPTKQL